MSHHLPVLLVAVPLVAAPIAALLNRARLSWLVALAASWWALYAALALLSRTLSEGVIRYALGGWAAPYGIEYVVDPVSAWVILIIAFIAAVVTPYALSLIHISEPTRPY